MKLIDDHAIIRLKPEHAQLTISAADDVRPLPAPVCLCLLLITIQHHHGSLQLTGNIHNLPEDATLVFTANQCSQLSEHLEGYARTLYIEARDAQERNRGNHQMRTFLIILFLFFAYDDLWAYIQNPFIFMFTLIVGGASLALWYLNLMQFVTPYLQRGLNEAVKSGQQYASAYIPGAKPKTE